MTLARTMEVMGFIISGMYSEAGIVTRGELLQRAYETWRPLSMGARPTPDANGALTLTLGEGEYELAPWTGDSWQPLKITVPGPMQLETSLTAPRGGRP